MSHPFSAGFGAPRNPAPAEAYGQNENCCGKENKGRTMISRRSLESIRRTVHRLFPAIGPLSGLSTDRTLTETESKPTSAAFIAKRSGAG